MGHKKNCSGFTLVELIVVTSILVILLAFAVPHMIKYFKASHRTAGRTEAHLLADAVQRYVDDKMEKGELTGRDLLRLMNQDLSNPGGELEEYLKGGQDEAKIASLNVNMNEGRLLSLTYESKYYKVKVIVDRNGNRTLEDEQIK